MLLIFDLDDTLIPTSEELTPKRLRAVLEEVFSRGWLLGDKNALHRELFELHVNGETTTDVLRKFFEAKNQDAYLYALNAIARVPLEITEVKSLEKEIRLLEELRKDHLLAIVTKGSEPLQREKMELYGLEEEFFERIYVVQEGEKKGDYYEKLAYECDKDFSEIMVIGDKIELDLYDAKKLGCTTVHIRQGRGRNQTKLLDLPDFVIDDLKELRNIVYDD